MRRAWDAIVVGSGFAGSITAAGLARLGLRVLMLDRHPHPRFAIGESSTPLASLQLELIAERHRLDELRPFTSYGRWCRQRPDVMRGCKQGFAYLSTGTDGAVDRLLVAAAPTREDADTQWLRSDFDRAMFQLAVACGVEARAPVEVEAWAWDAAAGAWRLRIAEDDVGREVSGGLLVDAAGLGPATTPRRWRTRTSAVFAHFEGVPRATDLPGVRDLDRANDPFDLDDAVIHVLADHGWLWLIRFDDGRVSAGFVDARPTALASARRDVRDLRDALPSDPLVQACLRRGRQVTPTRRIARLQWRRAAVDGPRFARLPHAAGFVDPLHSTGNAHALAGVLRILGAVAGDGPLQPALDRHHALTMIELDHLDRLVGCAYPFLGDIARFEPWSMLYFCAATSGEQALRAGRRDGTGFALAGEAAFAALVERAVSDQTLRGAPAAVLHEQLGRRFAPWNRAGLWDPARGGIYPFIEAPAGHPGVTSAS